MADPYHVRHYEKKDGEVKWWVIKSGSTIPSKSFDDKGDALGWADEKAEEKQSEVVIHRKDGTIASRKRYGC